MNAGATLVHYYSHAGDINARDANSVLHAMSGLAIIMWKSLLGAFR